MNTIQKKEKSKNFYALLVVIFLIGEVLFAFEVLQSGEGNLAGAIIKTVFILIFIWLTYNGHRWAKWVATILLSFYGLICLLAGFEIPSLLMKIIGLYDVLFAILPHLSKRFEGLSTTNMIQPQNPAIERIDSKLTKDIHFPYLIERYKALLVDFLLLFVLMVGGAKLNEYLDLESGWVVVIYLLIVISYEPFFTTFSSTLGQKLTNIRVRDFNNQDKKISLLQAYMRFIVKGLLGWVSFLTINFNRERRAIHDYVANSIVIDV